MATSRERDQTSLREQALRVIRAAIVYGELAPGEIHSAPTLAQRIGVSVTPVREAMLELASRGMIEPLRNRGFRVVERTPAELDAMLELRALVEVPTLARLAGVLGGDELAQAHAVVEDTLRAARAGDLIAFLDADRRFHLGLLALAGNQRIVDLVDRLRDQLRLRGYRAAGGAAQLIAVACGHREIVEAIAVGDAAGTERSARAHLGLTRRDWAGALDAEAGGAPAAASAARIAPTGWDPHADARRAGA
jgi:DNA-binding GntR family transcriptional regulator